jgi:uncharacterized protein YaiE (UPF0345 family)
MTPEFRNVTAVAKANVYFDGKVLSHTLLFADGSKKTLGIIFPGEFRFDTGPKEGMEMTAGSCRVRLKGRDGWTDYRAGDVFEIPGNSHFDIAVDQGIAEYICSFG